MIVFGYAATFDVHNVATAILDLDHSQESRELISRFASSGYFQMSDVLGNGARSSDLIDRGSVTLAIQIHARLCRKSAQTQERARYR